MGAKWERWFTQHILGPEILPPIAMPLSLLVSSKKKGHIKHIGNTGFCISLLVIYAPVVKQKENEDFAAILKE